MTTAASTIASSADGITKPSRPDYRSRMQEGINRRKPPEGALEHVERIVLIPE